MMVREERLPKAARDHCLMFEYALMCWSRGVQAHRRPILAVRTACGWHQYTRVQGFGKGLLTMSDGSVCDLALAFSVSLTAPSNLMAQEEMKNLGFKEADLHKKAPEAKQ